MYGVGKIDFEKKNLKCLTSRLKETVITLCIKKETIDLPVKNKDGFFLY